MPRSCPTTGERAEVVAFAGKGLLNVIRWNREVFNLVSVVD